LNLYCIIGFFFIAYLFISFRFYKGNIYGLDIKKYKFSFLFKSCAFLLDGIHFFECNYGKTKYKEFVKLYPGENTQQRYRVYILQRLACILFAFLFVDILCIVVSFTESNIEYSGVNTMIERPSYGEGSKELQFDVTLRQGDKNVDKKVFIEVDPRSYTQTELQKLIDEVDGTLENTILGDNHSLNEVQNQLNLIKNIDSSPIEISWESSNEQIISLDGAVNNEGINKEEKVELIATISAGKIEKLHTFQVVVIPKMLTWEEKIYNQFMAAIRKQNDETMYKQNWNMPTQVDDISIQYHKTVTSTAQSLFGLGILLSAVMVVVMREKNRQKSKEREMQLLLDYPEMVYKVIFLMGAGMTVKRAWAKIVKEYEFERNTGAEITRYVYEEMLITWNEMSSGIAEMEAITHFGKRIELKPYLRFSSLLAQNIKKGAKGLLEQLEYEGREALEERQQLAKRLGEEAGTKMLFPMIMMLAIVLLIVMVPAVLSIS